MQFQSNFNPNGMGGDYPFEWGWISDIKYCENNCDWCRINGFDVAGLNVDIKHVG